jgi:hypothetical protein
MTVLLVLMVAVLVVSCSLVTLSLCVSASRGDELLGRHTLERWEREGVNRRGAALRAGHDRRGIARSGSPERRGRPQLSV